MIRNQGGGGGGSPQTTSASYSAKVCICIEIFDNFLLANMKNQDEKFLPIVNICFSSKDVTFLKSQNCGFYAPLTRIMMSQLGLCTLYVETNVL